MAGAGDFLDKSGKKPGRISSSSSDFSRAKKEQEELRKIHKQYQDKEYREALSRITDEEDLRKSIQKKWQAQQKEELKKATTEAAEITLKYGDKAGERWKAAVTLAGDKLLDGLSKFASQTFAKAEQSLNNAMSTYAQYMGKIDARMQGTGKTFSQMMDLIGDNLSFSPLVAQTEVLKNLSALVEKGIAYNVEQRAFLATVSDRITSTFDAFDANLLQLIRIQQADTTLARMGMENTLTKFLNTKFQDTSYLSTTYDAVSQALLEAESQLGRNAGVEFEYTVQKWLGSLGSVGVQSSTLQSFAKGINALVTGDLETLASNSALQNLLVLASSRAGISYGSALNQGISSQDANKLLKAMIEYTQEIAKSESQVVKSRYAQLFGVTLSDMTAILNLSSADLKDIANNMIEYSNAVTTATNELNTGLSARTHISEKVQNLFENVLLSTGMDIASNAATYMTWKAASLIKDVTGGIEIPIPIPFVGTYTIELMNVIKTGLVGLTTFGNLIGSLSNLGKSLKFDNALDMFNSRWNATEFTARGSGFQGINAGADTTTSFSAYVGSSDTSGLKEQSINQASEEAKTIADSNQEESEMTQILKILQSWDLGGFGVKSILVSPTDTSAKKVIGATLEADSPVKIIDMSSRINTDDDTDYTLEILELLKTVINNNRVDVNTLFSSIDKEQTKNSM